MDVEISSDITGSPEAYLNENVLQEALEYALGDCRPVQIVKMVYEPGSSVGDNFLGLIFRIKVHYRCVEDGSGVVKVHSFIAKCLPDTEANDFLRDCQIFLKEKIIYQEILPRLQALHLDGEVFGPKLYHTIRKPKTALIMEDLQTLHYGMASREIGLDFGHCCLVLQKLGKFHAMSMILKKKYPDLTRSLHSGIVCEKKLIKDGVQFKHYDACLDAFEATVRTWNGYESIADKIRKFHQNFRENLLRSVEPQPNDINVINHGDLWVNNALFKYNSVSDHNVPGDVIFVDFQMTLWGSLGFDLNYFLNTSVQLDVLKTKRLDLIRIYYDSLSSTLKSHQHHGTMELHIPTFSRIVEEVEKRESWGFYAAFFLLPLISMDKAHSDVTIDSLQDEEFARKKTQEMLNSKRVQETLKHTLRRFDEFGVFGEKFLCKKVESNSESK